MTTKKYDAPEVQYFRDYYGYYRDFVKMLTLLSGAIIPVVLSVAQNATPTPGLLKCAVLGNLVSFLAGLVSIHRATISPLHDAVAAVQENSETDEYLERSGISGFSELRHPATIERGAHNIQKAFFVLSLIPMVVYFLLQ